MLGLLNRVMAIVLGYVSGSLTFFFGARLLFSHPGTDIVSIIASLAAVIPSLLIFSWVTLKPNPSLVHFLLAGIATTIAAILIGGAGVYGIVVLMFGFLNGTMQLALLSGCTGGFICWGYLILTRQIALRWC